MRDGFLELETLENRHRATGGKLCTKYRPFCETPPGRGFTAQLVSARLRIFHGLARLDPSLSGFQPEPGGDRVAVGDDDELAGRKLAPRTACNKAQPSLHLRRNHAFCVGSPVASEFPAVVLVQIAHLDAHEASGSGPLHELIATNDERLRQEVDGHSPRHHIEVRVFPNSPRRRRNRARPLRAGFRLRGRRRGRGGEEERGGWDGQWVRFLFALVGARALNRANDVTRAAL